ncbi:MAG TPA: caspase family protein [Pyrinomonadaceae bacterium]
MKHQAEKQSPSWPGSTASIHMKVCLLNILTTLLFTLLTLPTARAQGPELVLQTGHINTVRVIAISPNGKHLASAGADKSILLWEVATGRQLYSLEGHVEWVSTLAFSPDGKLLASGSPDRMVKLWDISEGKEAQQFSVPSVVSFVAFSPDGKTLAVAGKDKIIRLWDVPEKKIKAELTGHTDHISKVAFADEKHLLSSGWDGDLRLWDLATGTSGVAVHLEGRMKSFAFSRNFIACGNDYVVSVVNIKAPSFKLDIPHERLFDSNSLAFISNKELVLVDGFKLRTWDVEAGKETQATDVSAGYAVSVSQDRSLLAYGDEEAVHLLNLTTKATRILRGYLSTVDAVTFSADGKAIFASLGGRLGAFGEMSGLSLREGVSAALSLVNRTRVFLPSTGEVAHLVENERGEGGSFIVLVNPAGRKSRRFSARNHTRIKSIAVNPKGTILASGGEDKTLILWDVTGRVPWKVRKESAELLAFSPDGELLAAVGEDGTIKLFKVKTWTKTEIPGRGHIKSILFSPDGKILASLGVKQTKRILDLWEVPSGRHLRSLDPDSTPEEILRLWGTRQGADNAFDQSARVLFGLLLDSTTVSGPMAFSPDNRYIACEAVNRATANYDIKVWDAQTGATVHKLSGHRSSIHSIAFSPDGKVLASGGLDKTLRLWDARGGKELAAIVPLNQDDWIAFTPDGRFDTNLPLEEVGLLHWVMPGDALNPLPLDIFMRDYFEPKLLERVLASEALKPVRDISTLNRTQPTVVIREVRPDGAGTAEVTVEVANAVSRKQFDTRGRAMESGVYDVRLYRDGQLVGGSTADEALESYAKAAGDLEPSAEPDASELRLWQQAHQVRLNEGGRGTLVFRNVRLPQDGKTREVAFSAYAFNNDRVKSSTARKTFALPPTRPRKGRAYVVTVGANLYENPAFNLSYAANDARRMQQALTSRLAATGRYEEVVPVSLISDAATVRADATKANFRAVLRLLAGKSGATPELGKIANAEKLRAATPDDLVLILYSGHGFTGPKGLFYLVPYDTGEGRGEGVTARLRRRSISSDELGLWLREVDAGQMALIVDACYSAAAVENEEFKPGPLGSRGLGQLAYDKGMLILSATQADNVAHEGSRINQGLLSYVLVKDGMEEMKADFEPTDGVLTLREWLRYGVVGVPRLFEQIIAGKTTAFDKTLFRDAFRDSAGRVRAVQQPSLFDFARGRGDVALANRSATR